jgi:hypothetical protein
MSTSETVDFNKGPCPCGNGALVKHVTTQDNPWSSADIAYTISCAACATTWRVDGNWLTLKSSEQAHDGAWAEELEASSVLDALIHQLVNGYFMTFSAPSKKAEHTEMVRLGITSQSYRQYLEHKRNGDTSASACFARNNESWLYGLATEQGCGISDV